MSKLHLSYGERREYEPTRAILHETVSEALAVAKSCGIDTGFPEAAAHEQLFDGKFLPPTFAYRSSTLQELNRKIE